MNILDKVLKKGSRRNEKSRTVDQKKMDSGPKQAEKKPLEKFEEGLVSVKDIVAPAALEVDFNHLRINNRFYRTLFVSGYPAFVTVNWLSSLINFDHPLSVSMHVYPSEGKQVLDDLRRKIAEMEAEISTDMQRGKVVNPATQAKLEDALRLQTELVKGEERFFQFGLYVTISAKSKDELDQVTNQLEAALGALLIVSKKATLQMEEGFITCLPICQDKLAISRNMDTTALATTFPFVSSDLSDDKGIMYGINQHNGSLVIFDRFSMENYNSVIFAKSGAGKSYLVKLEVLRSLMMEAEVIVIDPENEYKTLCEAVGGQYVAFGFDEKSKINPFELAAAGEEENENELQRKILSLHGLFKVIMGKLEPEEDAMLDRALVAAYKMKGITPDKESQDREPPLIEDLYKSLIGMEDPKAQSLAARLEKFIKGSFAGIFNSQSTVDLKKQMVVFGIKDLEETLRPVAMYIVLDYIWTRVRKDNKKRILVVDEAWYLMQHPDSALFLYGMTKRARKYYLAVTTITQDVEDFLSTNQGKAIVTNSSIQILLKQHPAAIDKVSDVFYLSEGEKQLLLSAGIGEGIFFAGQNHVAIKIVASPQEHELITSDPAELLARKEKGEKVKIEMKKEEEAKAQEETLKKTKEIEEKRTEGEKVETGERVKIEKEVGIEKKEEGEKEGEGLSTRIANLEARENKKLEEAKIRIEKEEKEKKIEEERKKKEEEERRKKMYGGAGAFRANPWAKPTTQGTWPATKTAAVPALPGKNLQKKGGKKDLGTGWVKAENGEERKAEEENKSGVDYKKLAKQVWGENKQMGATNNGQDLKPREKVEENKGTKTMAKDVKGGKEQKKEEGEKKETIKVEDVI